MAIISGKYSWSDDPFLSKPTPPKEVLEFNVAAKEAFEQNEKERQEHYAAMDKFLAQMFDAKKAAAVKTATMQTAKHELDF